MELTGYKSKEEDLVVFTPNDGTEIIKRYFLEKQLGRLKLTSVPPKAEVYLDGRYVGVTPLLAKQLDRTSNAMRLIFRLENHHDETVVLNWDNQTMLEHTVTLKKRD